MDIPIDALNEAGESNKDKTELPIESPNKKLNYVSRLGIFYSILWEKKYGMKPTISFAQVGKVAKELVIDYQFNEYQIAYLMIMFFDWAGASGDDEFTRKKLESSTHSIFMLKLHIDSMRAYSKNRLGVDVDELEQIKPIVDKTIR